MSTNRFVTKLYGKHATNLRALKIEIDPMQIFSAVLQCNEPEAAIYQPNKQRRRK